MLSMWKIRHRVRVMYSSVRCRQASADLISTHWPTSPTSQGSSTGWEHLRSMLPPIPSSDTNSVPRSSSTVRIPPAPYRWAPGSARYRSSLGREESNRSDIQTGTRARWLNVWSFKKLSCCRSPTRSRQTSPPSPSRQAAHPSLWLPEDCATARQNLRRRNRQGCGTTGPGRPLPSRTSPRWPFVAHVPGPHEGQSLEPGLVPDGVDSREDSLGTGRHGPIQPADHWLWRGSRRCRRLGSVPHA